MLTRTVTATAGGLAVGLLIGLLGRGAVAENAVSGAAEIPAAVEMTGRIAPQFARGIMDEIVVYGEEAVALAELRAALFRSEIDGYFRVLEQRLKANLDTAVEGLPAPEIRLAAGVLHSRG